MRAKERVDIIMQRVLALFFPFFSLLILLLCALFNKSENVSVDSSPTKLWMIYVKWFGGEKRFERRFQGSDALINVTCIGYHLNDG